MRKWISVEDKLPGTDRFVLVQISGRPDARTELVKAVMIASYFPGDGWILREYPEWENANPVAWMEMPKPYKEKK